MRSIELCEANGQISGNQLFSFKGIQVLLLFLLFSFVFILPGNLNKFSRKYYITLSNQCC